jgi:DNA-binding beta-propeller fold protein YncE
VGAHSTPALRLARVGIVLLGVAALVGCGGRTSGVTKVPRAPFWPQRVPVAAPVRELLHTPLAPGAPGPHRYEYVFPDRRIEVYDIDHGFRLVASWSVPAAHGFRGIAVSPATEMLYLSVGGNGGSSGSGKLIAYDLRTNSIRWERAFPTGTDSPAITPDGRRLYLPTGERTTDNVWYVVAARTGEVTAEIHAGPGPHNTIVAPDGRRVYLGPRNSRFLFVAATATGRILRRIGPLSPGVRPFTINGAQTLAFTTATGVLGFQVSSIHTGKVLYTVPVHGFRSHSSLGTPSHGISLAPDSRELYLLDVPNSYVHVYDVSGLPARAPRQTANIAVTSMKGLESPCGGDCGRAGWLQHSLDGRYVFVGDAGDVIDTRTRRVVAVLPGLRNSRYQFELDWRRRRPVATSTRSGIGRLPAP